MLGMETPLSSCAASIGLRFRWYSGGTGRDETKGRERSSICASASTGPSALHFWPVTSEYGIAPVSKKYAKFSKASLSISRHSSHCVCSPRKCALPVPASSRLSLASFSALPSTKSQSLSPLYLYPSPSFLPPFLLHLRMPPHIPGIPFTSVHFDQHSYR